jgi:hypothetical protein
MKFGLTKFQPLGSPISNDGTAYDEWGATLGFLLGGVLFGALHIAAWNFIFPSKVEQIVWWIASLMCTSFFLLFIPIGALAKSVTEDLPNIIFVSVSILYILARLFLMIEIFRTLCFLPPYAYAATWASNIPHIT